MRPEARSGAPAPGPPALHGIAEPDAATEAPGPAEDRGGGAQRRRRNGVPRGTDALLAIALAAAPFLVYWRLAAPGPWRRYFPDGDFIDQFLAFASYEVSRLASGALPLWNPYAFGGSPFWADVQAAVAYPPSLLNAVAHALLYGRMTLLGLELEAVGHMGIAAALAYLFARRALGSRVGGVVAAAAFAASGYLAGYPPLQLALLEAVAWLPLALLGVELLAEGAAAPPASWEGASEGGLRERIAGGGAAVGTAALAAGLALSVLAGHPQTAMYVVYLVGAYAMWRLRPWRHGRRRLLGPLSLAVGLAAVASAAGWLPAAEYLRLSNRVALPYEALAHGFPPAELFGLLLPGLTHWSPLYVGLLALLLAAGAVVTRFGLGGPRGRPHRAHAAAPDTARGQHRDVPFWLGALAVGLLLALGGAGPLYDWLFLLAPGWDLFRGQERAAVVVVFSLAMLAGSGAARWAAGDDRVRQTVLWGSPTIAVIMVAVAATGAGDGRRTAVGSLVLLVLIAAAAVWAARPRPPAVLSAVLVGLIMLDVVPRTAGVNLVAEPPAELGIPPDVAVVMDSGPTRVQNEDRLPGNFGVLHGLELTSGASPLWVDRWARASEALRAAGDGRHWDLMGVSHVITWRGGLQRPADHLATAGEGEDVRYVFRFPVPAERAWRVPKAKVVSDAEATARLSDPSFSFRSSVLLHDGEGGEAPLTSGGLSLDDHGPGRLALTTDGAEPAWILLSEVYYPGWRAKVDGAAVPLRRADLAFMAVAVPPGEHRVEVDFQPRSVAVGLLLSVAGWAAVGVVAWMGFSRRRRRPLQRRHGGTPPP